MSIHEKYMRRCLQLAENGLGTTYPNPLVGCVIVHKGRVIGEGWHREAGQAHAEVLAIQSVSDKSLLKESELYVNLEPCSHHGRTPPCADLIIDTGIPRVFIGSLDENALVRGAGISRLQHSGCEVSTGVLEAECRELNRRFFTYHTRQRPYIILKWAESADGFVFPSGEQFGERGPVWISNPYSRQLVHRWRAEEESILVGTRTVEQDDPSLTVREFRGNDMLRLVIDKKGKLSWKSKVFQNDVPTVVFSSEKASSVQVPNHLRERVRIEGLDFEASLPEQIGSFLWKQGVQSLIVEGGAVTLNSFIKVGLWDEARVFRSKAIFSEGIKAPAWPGTPFRQENLLDDQLFWIRNQVEEAPVKESGS